MPFSRPRLLYGDGLGEVAGLVYVAAAADGDVVGEELEGDDFEDGEEQLGGGGDVDDGFDELGDGLGAFDGDGDDAAGAGGDFLDVGEGLLVLEDGGRVGGVLGGDADDGEGLVDEGVGAVLHLAGGVAFGVDVGDFFQLERAFEGDGVVDAAAEEEEVVGGGEVAGELGALVGEGEAGTVAAVGAGVGRSNRRSFDSGRCATFAQDDRFLGCGSFAAG